MAKGRTAPKSGLQVKDHRGWQERFWTAQRIGWALMALIVLAALLGATGKGGWWANARVQLPGATIEYPRISRWQSNEQFTVRLAPATSGLVELELSSPFIERFMIEAIEPEPLTVRATGGGHRYTFDIAAGEGEKVIVFAVRSEHPFLARPVTVRIGDGPPARMTLTVLP